MIDDCLVVNALGALDNPNSERGIAASRRLVQTVDDVTVDERVLDEARASGLTAVNITVGHVTGDAEEPFEYTVREIAAWDAIIRRNPARLTKILTAADILAAKRDGMTGLIYGFQNTTALGEDASRTGTFADLGVRIVQLTYNPPNRVGSGCMAATDTGLTPFGHEVVERLCEARVMVDLSHSGERTCLDAVRASPRPVSINHTGCRALADLPRNKSDEELRLVASRGGFVGIYFMPFLHVSGHPTADDVVAHIAHAVDVCGEDHVGIGTDGTVTTVDDLDAYRVRLAEHVAARRESGAGATGERADTTPFVVDLRGVDQFRELAARLERRGFSSETIEKIVGRNFVAYAREIWGEAPS